LRLSAELMYGLRTEYYTECGRPDIRAQLLDTSVLRLEMDFIVEGDERSFNILNAVSPEFTCAMTFGEYAFQKIRELIH